ncbi:MAG: heat-shock protein [Candidatus Methanoperedenaceae archaeon]|nr:heat-shock protein [Candidatus Methanoperedenaceae archaeon]MDW7725907.1 heat-shock protein [Candidatus Methanoperedens sp.]
MGIKFESNDFTRALGLVVAMALVMISVAYGIEFMLEGGKPLPTYILLFVFSIVFVMASVFFEKRGAEYPWFLIGGGIASACVVFLITASVGGILYVREKGFEGLGIETIFYSLSICMILSMILLSLVRHKL